MKIGTSGLLRAAKSIFDYIIFYEIRLARRPRLVVVVLSLSLLLPVAITILGPRDWWLHPSWSLLVYVGAIVKFIWNLARPDAPRVGRFEVNSKVRENLKSAHSPEYEKKSGFNRVSRNSGFDGPVVLSDKFNAEKMCDPDTDWPLDICAGDDIRDEIVGSLKKQRVHFVNYGRQAMLNAIFRNKALINEKKVAFAEDFPPIGNTISVYQTDYFTSLCSAERRLEDVVEEENGVKSPLIDAKDWNAFQWREKKFRLPKIFGNSPPMSLHVGIEVLAVSADDVFRVALQSKRTEFSQNMRAPLGSGSVDWSDTHGASSLKAAIRNAARRELSEEWGGTNTKIYHKLNQLTPEPIGYFRNVLRLGKPQFVCLVRLNCKDHELSADVSEVFHDTRASFYTPDLVSLAGALDSILKHHGHRKDSAPLLGAAHILKHLINEREERVSEILGF